MDDIAKNSFILYLSYSQQFALLDIEERGKLITAIFAYVGGESVPKLVGATAMAFSFIKLQLDRDGEKYSDARKKNKVNGIRGGRPKNPNAKNESAVATENARMQKSAKTNANAKKCKKMKKRMQMQKIDQIQNLRMMKPIYRA